MSVFGELTRHLDSLITALETSPDAGQRALAAALREARPARNTPLERSARQIQATLERHAQAAARASDEVETVGALCRIVLGQPAD